MQKKQVMCAASWQSILPHLVAPKLANNIPASNWSFLKSHVYYLPRPEIIMSGHQRQTCTRLFITVCSNRMWTFLPARQLQSHNFMFVWSAMAVVVNQSLGAVTLTSTVYHVAWIQHGCVFNKSFLVCSSSFYNVLYWHVDCMMNVLLCKRQWWR
jgi:hypothetical protein